jgi:hypothetical protein
MRPGRGKQGVLWFLARVAARRDEWRNAPDALRARAYVCRAR